MMFLHTQYIRVSCLKSNLFCISLHSSPSNVMPFFVSFTFHWLSFVRGTDATPSLFIVTPIPTLQHVSYIFSLVLSPAPTSLIHVHLCSTRVYNSLFLLLLFPSWVLRTDQNPKKVFPLVVCRLRRAFWGAEA